MRQRKQTEATTTNLDKNLPIEETPFVKTTVEVPFFRRIGNNKAACDEIVFEIGYFNNPAAGGMPKYNMTVLRFHAGAELSLDAAKHQFKVSSERLLKKAIRQ